MLVSIVLKNDRVLVVNVLNNYAMLPLFGIILKNDAALKSRILENDRVEVAEILKNDAVLAASASGFRSTTGSPGRMGIHSQ